MKKILLVIIAMLLAVSLAGCSLDSLGDYKKAAEKTDQIIKGRSTGEFSLEMDFNTEGMAEEQIKQLNYFKTMKGSFDVVYDDETKQSILRNYLSFGGLGFDFDLFVNGEEVFMKLPVIGKYVRMDELQGQMAIPQACKEIELISKETKAAINDKWVSMLKKEDIFKGKDIVLTTPDGEVKTTEYTIRLNDEQVKNLAAYSIDMLSKDEKLKVNYKEYTKKIEPLKDKSFEELFYDIKDNMKEYTVESFNYTAYVDIDGYIVNETVDFSVKVDDTEAETVKKFSYKLDTKNWDINREQKFEFPVLTEENTLDTDDMYKNMPFMMEDLFNNKD